MGLLDIFPDFYGHPFAMAAARDELSNGLDPNSPRSAGRQATQADIAQLIDAGVPQPAYGMLNVPQAAPPAPQSVTYPSPINTAAKDQSLAEMYAAAGMSPPAAPDPFAAAASPTAPAAPASPFTGGGAPFSFAGPGSNNVSPAQIAAPPPVPMPQPRPPGAAAAPGAAAPAASPAAAPAAPAAAAGDDDDETPANAAPTQGALPAAPGVAPAAPAAAPFSLGGIASGIGSRLGDGFRGLVANAQTGPVGALLGGVAGLAGMAQPNAQQQLNRTAQALVSKGASPADAAAAVGNPALMSALINQYYGKDKYKVQQTGEDGMGRKTFQLFNESDGTFKAIPGAEAAGAGAGSGGLGDMTKTGAEYLATIPPQQAQIVKGMVDGTIQPPSSFALAKPAWQAMLAAAKNVDPNFDANTWAARHKMTTDIASSGNSSMGGILANGKSSFAHLADLSKSMSELGNASHDFPGGAAAAYVQNRVGNAMGGSDTAAKLKAINDNLGHYGQESTKFYSGTGGGAEERMNALKEMNPNSTSSEEMAAYLDKEKSLMTDRLREKEGQIRSTMGDAYLQQHPVFTPELQQTMGTIDANIAKLRGQAAPAPAAPPSNGALPSGWSVQVR